MRLVVERTFFNVIEAEDDDKDKSRTLTRSMSAPTLGSTREETDIDDCPRDANSKADCSKAPLQAVTATDQAKTNSQQRLRGRMFASESYARLKQRSFASESTTASKINHQMLFDEDSDSEGQALASPSPSPPSVRGLAQRCAAAAPVSSVTTSAMVTVAPAAAAAGNAGVSTAAPAAGNVLTTVGAPAPVPPKSVPCPNFAPFDFVRGDAIEAVVTPTGPNLPAIAEALPLVLPPACNTKPLYDSSVAYVSSMAPALCSSLHSWGYPSPAEATIARESGCVTPQAMQPQFSSGGDSMSHAIFSSHDNDAFMNQDSNHPNQRSSTCVSTPAFGPTGLSVATSSFSGPNYNSGTTQAAGASIFGAPGSHSSAGFLSGGHGSLVPEPRALGSRAFGAKGPSTAGLPGLRKMRAELKAAVKASGISIPNRGDQFEFFEPVHEEKDDDDDPCRLGMDHRTAFRPAIPGMCLGPNPLPVDSYSQGYFGGRNDDCNASASRGFGGMCGCAARGPVGVAGGSLKCCGGCGLGCCNAGCGGTAGCGSPVGCGGCGLLASQESREDGRDRYAPLMGPLAPQFQLPRITRFHSFHREVRHFGDLSPDGRRFTKRAFENRLSLVCEGTVQTGGTLRYLAQFSGGPLSTADGVGFVFCRKLPCPKDIQQIVSIFLNRHGAICLRAHSELVRLNTRLRPLSIGDWIEVEIDLNNATATFTLWPCDEDNEPLVGTFAYYETFMELRNRAPRRVVQQKQGRVRREAHVAAGGEETAVTSLDLQCGYLACVVKNLGVSLQLGS